MSRPTPDQGVYDESANEKLSAIVGTLDTTNDLLRKIAGTLDANAKSTEEETYVWFACLEGILIPDAIFASIDAAYAFIAGHRHRNQNDRGHYDARAKRVLRSADDYR